MKKIFAVLLTSTLLFSCQNNKETYVLEGEAQGYADDTKIIIQNFSFKNNYATSTDTLTVKDGKFSGTFQSSKKPLMNFIRVENEGGNIIYFPEDTDLKVTIYKDSIHKSFVEGGKHNKSYYEYKKREAEFIKEGEAIHEQYKQAVKNQDTKLIALLQSKDLNLQGRTVEFRKEFIKTQPKSIFSVMILSQMVDYKEITALEAFNYLEDIDSGLAEIEVTKELKAKLEILKKSDIGVKAPEFSGPTPEGETLALSDALGKYTIIDFWASWCKPCRDENPNVVEVYKKYHDKGLNIIGVSLDRPNQKDQWLKAIEDDGLDWYHVSNLQFWNEPIIKDYNIRAIPATFLLDENGVIIDKDLRGESLRVKMATLFADE